MMQGFPGGGRRGVPPPVNNVTIKVVDQQHIPIDDATVTLGNTSLRGNPSLRVGVSGVYSFPNVTAGNHPLHVERRHYKKYDREINIRQGQRPEYTVVLEMSERGKIVQHYKRDKSGIEKLGTDGKITQKDAEKLLKDLQKKYLQQIKEAAEKEKMERGEFTETPEMKKMTLEKRMRDEGTWYRKMSLNSQKLFEEKMGAQVGKVFNVLVLIILGFILSWYFEGTWSGKFALGFLLLGISTLFPDHKEIEDLPHNFILDARTAISMNYLLRKGHRYSAVKSAMKFGAVYFFIIGARDATAIGFLANILLIVVAALSYFSFSSEYNPRIPGQIMESTARLFIGLIIIPWWVFYGIFQSFVLGIMAMAFFAVPPAPLKEKEGESVVRGEWMRWMFAGLMVIALIGSGVFGETSIFNLPTWGLTGALRSTFLYFWLVCFIAGFFSPSTQRPATGFLMLTAATMIYAVGPGTQEVGSALLGPWFGKAFAGLTEFMAPVTDAFNQIGNTFGTAFQMLVNPVGFAQGIMTGTYTRDADTGLTGAYGVEVGNFRATPIFIDQAYSIIIPIQNKGSAEAKNIDVTLWAGTGVRKLKEGGVPKDLPKIETEFWHPLDPAELKGIKSAAAAALTPSLSISTKISDATTLLDTVGQTLTRKALDIQKLGFSTNNELGYTCLKYNCDKTLGRNLEKQDSEQVFFSSTGIGCGPVVTYGLLTEKGSKFLPFSAIISYDYEVESTLEIQAMSGEEWSRLAQEGMLYPSIKKPSIMKNSPVMLNLDTLEQPIREGTPFFIAFNLTPAISGKGWISDPVITLEMPDALVGTNFNAEKCTIKPEVRTKNSITIMEWKNLPEGQNSVYCYFTKMLIEEGNPTQTYYINARAEYRYNDIETRAFAIEFGGIQCCRDQEHAAEDCPTASHNCVDYKCVAGGEPALHVLNSSFCYWSTKKGIQCKAGQGGCDDRSIPGLTGSHPQCDPNDKPVGTGGANVCRMVAGVDGMICCQQGGTETDTYCKNKFEDFLKTQ